MAEASRRWGVELEPERSRQVAESAVTYARERGMERAAVVDALDGPVTGGVDLPAALFLRLTGGRHDGPSAPAGEVRLTGDVALAQRLVDSLAFTI